jgi:DNA segregation ATPase FtsK/SpoIIIE-like protein
VVPLLHLRNQNKQVFKVELRSLGMVSEDNDQLVIIVNKFNKETAEQLIRKNKQLPGIKTAEFFSKLDTVDTSDLQLPFSPGMDIFGNPIILDALSTGHIGVAGQTQAGKSNTISTSIMSLHKLSKGKFNMWIVDPTKVVAEAFKEYVQQIATMDNALEVIREIKQEINVRNDMLSANNALNIRELPEEIKPTTLIVVVEELRQLFDSERYRKEASEIVSTVESIIATGAKVGVYFWLCTQYLNKTGSSSIIHSQLQTRFVHWLNSPIENQTVWGNTDIANNAMATMLQGAGDFYLGVAGRSMPQRGHSVYITGKEIKEFFNKNEGNVCQPISELMQENLESRLSPKVVELFSPQR